LKESNKLYIRALKLVLGLPQNINGQKLLLILNIPNLERLENIQYKTEKNNKLIFDVKKKENKD
jgi:hypothetical protein